MPVACLEHGTLWDEKCYVCVACMKANDPSSAGAEERDPPYHRCAEHDGHDEFPCHEGGFYCPECIEDVKTRFAGLLDHVTGGRMSNTTYSLRAMQAEADATAFLAAREAARLAAQAERERCAKVALSVRGGFSARIRTGEDEPELIRDPDGPWVLNADVAAAILSEPSAPAEPVSNPDELPARAGKCAACGGKGTVVKYRRPPSIPGYPAGIGVSMREEPCLDCMAERTLRPAPAREPTKRWRMRDGRLIHDGDCNFWSYGICTCGLLAALATETERPDWHSEEWIRHAKAVEAFRGLAARDAEIEEIKADRDAYAKTLGVERSQWDATEAEYAASIAEIKARVLALRARLAAAEERVKVALDLLSMVVGLFGRRCDLGFAWPPLLNEIRAALAKACGEGE